MVFISAEQNADGRIVAFGHHVDSIPTDVSVELAEVLMAEAFELEFDQHVAFENAVIEHQVDKEMLVADQDAFLASFKAEAMTEFQQEVLQLVDELLLQMRFAHHLGRLQTEELENVRIANVQRRVLFGRLIGQFGQFGFIVGQTGAFEVQTADLPFQLADGPVASDRFQFVKGPLGFIFEVDDEFQVTVRKAGNQLSGGDFKLWGQCPHFCFSSVFCSFCDSRQVFELWGQCPHNCRI